MRKYQIISADGHMEVPIDWAKYVPAKYKERAPKLVKRENGSEVWRMDEWERENIANLYCGMRYNEFVGGLARVLSFSRRLAASRHRRLRSAVARTGF